MKKRILALTLALVMLVGLLPTAALASGIELPAVPVCDHENTTTTTVDATCVAAGSITVTCSDCGEVISETAIEQIVHETAGTCENCAIILDVPGPTTLTVGTLYYAANYAGVMNVTFNNAASVIYNEETYTPADEYTTEIKIEDVSAGRGKPAIFQITVEAAAEDEEPVVATAEFGFDLGHPQNPDTLYMGSNTATVEANNTDGYNYTWTASHDGEITITMPADSGWVYCWSNLTTGVAGSIIDSDTTDAVHTYTVAAGDRITLMVNSYDPANAWNSPAATIEFTANYPVGHEANPIMLVAEGTNELVAGTNNYVAYNVNGMILTINGAESAIYNGETYNAVDGVITIEGLTTGRGMPAAFVITAGEGATASFSYAAGHPSNPATLVIGENTATVEANSWDGYIFNWTATANGELKLNLPAEGWQYTLNNLTTGKYGDLMDYTSTDATHIYPVAAGDQIEILMNSFDDNDPYNTPAASITFTAELGEHEVNYTDNGDGTHNVSACACGSIVAIENEAHTFTDGTCVCGAVEVVGIPVDVALVPSGVSLSMQESISMQFQYRTGKLPGYDMTTFYIEYTQMVYNQDTGVLEPQTGRIDLDGKSSTKLALFKKSFVSWAMSEEISITAYGMKDGVLYKGEPYVTSIANEALLKFDDFKTQGNDSYCSVVVAMLNYGTASQETYNYNVANKANADFTDVHNAYVTSGKPELTGRTYGSTGTGTININRMAMSLQDMVYLQALIRSTNMPNPENYEVRFYKEGVLQTTIDGSNLGTSGAFLKAECAIPANSMSAEYTVAVYEKGTETQVSASWNYSIVARCEELYDNETLGALTQALMKYGNSVNVAFGS